MSYKSKITKRFAKQFGKCVGDFKIMNNDGIDNFLIPMDSDNLNFCLLYWFRYKITKTPNPFKVTPIYFYSSDEPDPTTLKILRDQCKADSVPFVGKDLDLVLI